MDTILEVERSYIGCLLTDSELIKESTLKEKHFLLEDHQTLFKALKTASKKYTNVDIVTLITELGSDKLSEIGGRKYLTDLLNSVASVEPFKRYEKMIIDDWKIRQAKVLKNKEIDSLDDLNNLMSDLSELELENSDEEYDHKQAVIDLITKVEEQKEGLSGIDTGFTSLNRMLDGFQGGDLIISAARPSVGKTAKMLNHALKHCQNGGMAVIFSLEMGAEQLNKRLISAIGRIDGEKMKNPKQRFNDKDWADFTVATGILSDFNLHIYDQAGQTVQQIRSKATKLKRKYPDVPMLIQIDYLQLIRTDGRYENKNVEVGEITRSLKELARDTDSPVYLLSQLSRGVESRQDKRPMMSDIRDSGNIEQDADVIEFLYREDYYDKETENKNIIEVIIAKQRNGAVGTVELYYQKEYNLFNDISYNHET